MSATGRNSETELAGSGTNSGSSQERLNLKWAAPYSDIEIVDGVLVEDYKYILCLYFFQYSKGRPIDGGLVLEYVTMSVLWFSFHI